MWRSGLGGEDGVVDIVWTVAGYTPGRFPHLEAFEGSPGAFKASRKSVHIFLSRKMDELLILANPRPTQIMLL